MLRSPWLPILIGLSCVAFGLCLAMMLPETLGLREPDSAPADLTDVEDEVEVSNHGAHWYRRARISLTQLEWFADTRFPG